MFTVAVTSLKAFIRRILRLPMAHTTELLRYLQASQGFTPIDDFQSKYTVADAMAILNGVDLNRGDLSSARIHSIHFVKRRRGAQHEFLVLTLKYGGHDWASAEDLCHLTLERTGADGTGASDHSSAVVSHSSASSSSPDSISSVTVSASDRVTLYPSDKVPYKDNDVVDDVKFRDFASAPLLDQAIAAAYTLHQHNPDYILRERQCYWFAGVLYRFLHGPFNEDLRLSRDITVEAADVNRKGKKVTMRRKAGTFATFFKIVTQMDIEEQFRAHEDDYKKALAELRAKVAEQKRKAIDAQNVAQIRKERDDAVTKAEKAEAKAEEAEAMVAAMRLELEQLRAAVATSPAQ